MLKKIWVTGGTGLVGRSLQAIQSEFPKREFVFSGSKECNLCDLSSVRSYLARHKVDAILHLAAVAGGVGYSKKIPATMLRDNVMMNTCVVEAARLENVQKVLMTLSTGMYPAKAPNPLREEFIHDGPPDDSNYSYSFAKRLVEPTIRAYRSEFGMHVIGAVPNGMFGEYADYREDRSIMLPALIRRFYENRSGSEPIIIWGDGSPLREYTYAQDMARAFMWCLDNYDDAQILHTGSTEENSVKDMAFMIADTMKISKDRLSFDTSKPAGIHRKSTDNSRFVKLSNFHYTPFREALEKTIRFFEANYSDKTKVRL